MTEPRVPSLATLDTVFDELESLLKDPDVGGAPAAKGVNVSLALTLADGVRAYVRGEKRTALLELVTATDEIAARMAGTPDGPAS